MRIALFSDAVPPRLDGVAVTVGRLARELAARGHDVALVGPGPFDDVDGVSLAVRVPGLALPTLPGLYGSMPWLGQAATRALDEFRPDLVHSLTEMPIGFAGRRHAQTRRLAFVTSAHTDYPAYMEHWGFPSVAPIMLSWMNWFHRRACVTLCPSVSYARVLRQRGHEGPLRIWSRGVDPKRFSPNRRSAELRRHLAPRGEKIVITVGRVVPEKRIDRLVDAFRTATMDSEDAVLVVVGDGSSRRTLARRAAPGVHFLGPLRGSALAEAYASSDLFATASEEETFGNAVLEAMASGLPVIVPRAGALVELVDASHGVVFERDELPNALRRALDDDVWRKRRGSAARDAALARSWSQATDEALEGYVFGLGRAPCSDLSA